jgi:hypothetical protein
MHETSFIRRWQRHGNPRRNWAYSGVVDLRFLHGSLLSNCEGPYRWVPMRNKGAGWIYLIPGDCEIGYYYKPNTKFPTYTHLTSSNRTCRRELLLPIIVTSWQLLQARLAKTILLPIPPPKSSWSQFRNSASPHSSCYFWASSLWLCRSS